MWRARPHGDTLIAIAAREAERGDASGLQGLLTQFQQLAESGTTTGEKFGIAEALAAIAAEAATATPSLDAVQGIADQAAPFLESLQSIIDAALGTDGGPTDLGAAAELLKQQGQAIAQVGDAQLSAIEAWRQEMLAQASTGGPVPDYVANDINARAKAMADAVQAGLDASLAKNALEQIRVTEELKVIAKAQLDAVTGGQDVALYQAEQLRRHIDLLAEISQKLSDLITGTPHAAGGLWRTSEGLHYLHDDERVLDAEDAEASRRWPSGVAVVRAVPDGSPERYRQDDGDGGTATVVHVHVDRHAVLVQGVSDPERAADLAVEKLGRKLEERFQQGGGIRYTTGALKERRRG